MMYFGSFWGCVGSIFGRFGASWGVFWRSWRVLEALGRLLGGLGAVLGRHGSPRVNFVDFRASKLRSTPSFGRSKGGQDEAKMGPKRHQNRCQKRSRKKMLLKIVLERSWVDLGSFWVPSWGPGSAPDITPADVS